jgi:hypothetical protein
MPDKKGAARVPPLPEQLAMPPFRYRIDPKGKTNGVASQQYNRGATGQGILRGSNLAG